MGFGEETNFPYPFLDWDLIGWLVIPAVLGISAFYIGMSYLTLWIDKKRVKRQTNRQD
jgi:hypothetical protein